MDSPDCFLNLRRLSFSFCRPSIRFNGDFKGFGDYRGLGSFKDFGDFSDFRGNYKGYGYDDSYHSDPYAEDYFGSFF